MKQIVYDIRIIPKENIDSIAPFLRLLNPKTRKNVLIKRLNDLRATDYKCAGVYHDSKLIAVSGMWVLNKIYAGKHIEPDNVVVHPDYRSKGIGTMLLNWIHAYACEIGCLTSELNSRITNSNGNKFWMNQGYEIVGFHFIKKLSNSKTSEDSINTCLLETE
jgi:GNAT superfamily N-acetyltransferase